uniref:M28 family peptidase n=1 Tax=Roseihalotalea indica TaxID=2867963 RepID=A0AA49GSS5_9BACT|nr:M28 family peptidase [Tunicatimonas sp. TK19036]
MRYLFLIFFSSAALTGFAQSTDITSTVQRAEVEAHVRFLASDALKGRDTGSPELNIAAQYIASYFQSYGLQPVDSTNGYFQPVALSYESAPPSATLSFQDQEFQIGSDIVVMSGDSIDLEAPAVFVNYGMPEDLEGVDVKGKIVIALPGRVGDTNPQSAFYAIADKKERIVEQGGLALIELYRSAQMPWSLIVRYLGGDKMSMDASSEEDELPILWLNDGQSELRPLFEENSGEMATLSVAPKTRKPIDTKNVVAILEGTDDDLKDEYVVLSAHYDHVGVNPQATGAQDSIYNGARDNAMGTTALLSAAKYFSEHPPKRSLLFLAFTAEEKGLLGSEWYAEHPLLPMEQLVFNLNTDGAGYNDTTKVTVIGLERTSAEEALASASESAGLEAIMDPVPEQNLYDRSDNVNFAQQGVPSVTFAPGTTAFDAELMKYYHQVVDEPESLNFSYVEKYCEAFVQAAENIADMRQAPTWQEGDKYEEAGKQLYGQ